MDRTTNKTELKFKIAMKKLLPFSLLVIHLTLFAQIGGPLMVNDVANLASINNSSHDTYPEDVDMTWMSNLYNSPLYIKTPKSVKYEEFTSDILKNRLHQLNVNTPFEVEYNTTIERTIRLYLGTRKNDISNLMDKAKYYFPIFEEYLDKYNLPLEIKYLAIVESALIPNARSSSGAKGLWQFMYHTGKQFGLNITSLVDERMDPLQSTEAACKYLKSLYETFHDWDLALAAYNSGPGNVSKAIRRSGGLRNYWAIRKFLPAETRAYIPAFYATYYLFEYANEHHIYPKDSEITYFETDTVHVKKKLTFKKIQNITGIDNKLLKNLNPQYKLNIIPADNDNFVLTLPKSLIGKFVSNEQKFYNSSESKSALHESSDIVTPDNLNSNIVYEKDNYETIAEKSNVSSQQLKNWSEIDTNYLIAGQRSVIRDKKNEPSKIPLNHITIEKDKMRKNKNTCQIFNVYTVKSGDSLFLISKKFPNVTIHQIRNWNNIWNNQYIAPGTQLKILAATE
jgi:membrane-bound lytic murein transglycosylase D